jgi:hypothetical protein
MDDIKLNVSIVDTSFCFLSVLDFAHSPVRFADKDISFGIIFPSCDLCYKFNSCCLGPTKIECV